MHKACPISNKLVPKKLCLSLFPVLRYFLVLGIVNYFGSIMPLPLIALLIMVCTNLLLLTYFPSSVFLFFFDSSTYRKFAHIVVSSRCIALHTCPSFLLYKCHSLIFMLSLHNIGYTRIPKFPNQKNGQWTDDSTWWQQTDASMWKR